MAVLAQQTFTIRRLIDGKTLNFLLQSNQALTQIFTPDPSTYVPNYTSSPYLVITPSLIISGEVGDQIARLKTAPTWKINGSATLSTFSATAASSAPYALTIKKNMTDVNQMYITQQFVFNVTARDAVQHTLKVYALNSIIASQSSMRYL